MNPQNQEQATMIGNIRDKFETEDVRWFGKKLIAQLWLRRFLRLGVAALLVTFAYDVINDLIEGRKEAAAAKTAAEPQKPAEVTVAVLPAGLEAIQRVRVNPLPRGEALLSVLDLDNITPELCAANLSAIQGKDFSKLKGRIVTKLTHFKTEWIKGTGDNVTVVERFVPLDPQLAATVADWQILSITKTTLDKSIAVREGVAHETTPQTAANDSGFGGFSTKEAAIDLFPVSRDGKKIYCIDLNGFLPLDETVATVPNLPGYGDQGTTIDLTTLPTIKRKSLDAADPGDFINSVFNIAVESVDDQGTIKGHLLDASLHPTDRSIEIRSADKGGTLRPGQGARYDGNYAVQVIQKSPLIIIDRTVHAL